MSQPQDDEPAAARESRFGDFPGQPIVVLDVDRSHASRRARRRLFAAPEFCVHEAAGASQAMEAAATHQPDVVLLSLDAADLCNRLKAGPGNIPVVILLIPAAQAGTDLPRCGADVCLPRSLPPAFLMEVLRTLLRMRRAERELSSVEGHLERGRQDLERSRTELVDFSMQIAHDIEGPLRGVVTFAELIGQAHPLSDNERTYLGHVLSSADQVRRLARCVLTYAQAKREQPRLAVVPLRGVVTAAVHALRERIEESEAALQIQDPLPSVLGDFSALQQVLQSLIGNALQYRRPNAGLSITIGASPHGAGSALETVGNSQELRRACFVSGALRCAGEFLESAKGAARAPEPSQEPIAPHSVLRDFLKGQESAGEWLISITDNGIGVAKQYHEAIFAPFKRLHGTEIPGAGMGLALCKHIVEAHGGRIWVESEPGCGASFRFTLRAPA